MSKLSLVNSAIVGDGLCCAVRGCHSCWAESVRGWRYAVVLTELSWDVVRLGLHC